MNTDTRFLNVMKFIMAIFVMVVHFSPFKTIHPVLHFISIHGFTRIAVPFFFLSSGYLLSEHGHIPSDRLKKTLKKLIKLYFFGHSSILHWYFYSYLIHLLHFIGVSP